MLRVRELAERAKEPDATGFADELGPFALMQRPDVVRPAGGAQRTMPLAPQSRPRSVPVDFQDLKVARLPAPGPDGRLMLIVGRDPECDLVIDDGAVSKRHAAIIWDGRSGVLQEMGSSNGSFVNGKRIVGPTRLTSTDQLAFGQSSFIYLLAADLHARLLRVR